MKNFWILWIILVAVLIPTWTAARARRDCRRRPGKNCDTDYLPLA